MSTQNSYTGIALAMLAVIIWSGNFIAARGVIHEIPPASLAFYRWLLAAIIIFPIAIGDFRKEWPVAKKSMPYLFWVSLSGIALFNTFVYIGAHHTTAINLALLGTTASPIMAVILAKVFLKEKLDTLKVVGMAICISGVLFLLSRGDFTNLLHFQFTRGDGWVLLAALAFAIYNTLVKRKPTGLSAVNFLFIIFSMGTILLLPYYLYELATYPAVRWSWSLTGIIFYLGLGASVICFLCWNMAIGKLGAGRTALFGNLIPVFSSIEAALILSEEFTWVHVTAMVLVFSGILLANWKIIRGR